MKPAVRAVGPLVVGKGGQMSNLFVKDLTDIEIVSAAPSQRWGRQPAIEQLDWPYITNWVTKLNLKSFNLLSR